MRCFCIRRKGRPRGFRPLLGGCGGDLPRHPTPLPIFRSEPEGRLPPGHGKEYVRQKFRIEQRAVKGALRIIDVVAPAERVKAVFLPRMETPGEG